MSDIFRLFFLAKNIDFWGRNAGINIFSPAMSKPPVHSDSFWAPIKTTATNLGEAWL